jgi:uncharacterized protein YecT (DUF1311 family)
MRLDSVHKAQRIWLHSVFKLRNCLVIRGHRGLISSRDYHSRLRTEDRDELSASYSEYMFFAAQSISHGFFVQGLQDRADVLTPLAVAVVANFQVVRSLLVGHSMSSAEAELSLASALKEADFAWTSFEEEACRKYFVDENKKPVRKRPVDIARSIFEKALYRAVKAGNVKSESVEDQDPSLFVHLPRMALLRAIEMGDEAISALCDADLDVVGTVADLASSVSEMAEEKISKLESMLCGNSKEETASDRELLDAFKETAAVADRWLQTKKSKLISFCIRRALEEAPSMKIY